MSYLLYYPRWSFYKTPVLYMFNDDLALGTDLEDSTRPTTICSTWDEELCQGKAAQRIASEEVIGIALCWDTSHRQIRGMDELQPEYVGCETWQTIPSIKLSKGREQGGGTCALRI